MRLLEWMKSLGVRPNDVVYNAAITACAKGDSARARQLLEEMRRAGLRPNSTSYTAAIGAEVP